MVIVRIGAVVLAGGRSERLGRPKQLLPWDSRTLIETVIDEVCRTPSLTAVVVVLRLEVAEQLGVQPGESLGCARVVLPETEGEGCAASYRSGLTALEDSRLDGVVIVLGDQPGLRAETIERVVKVWSESGAPLAATRYRDGEGHPLVFGKELFGELVALRGEKAAWKLVDRYRDRVLWVEFNEPMPRDIDTEEDYRAVREAWEGRARTEGHLLTRLPEREKGGVGDRREENAE